MFLMSGVWMSAVLILFSATIYRFDDIEIEETKKKGGWRFIWTNDSNAKLSIILFMIMTLVLIGTFVYTYFK